MGRSFFRLKFEQALGANYQMVEKIIVSGVGMMRLRNRSVSVPFLVPFLQERWGSTF